MSVTDSQLQAAGSELAMALMRRKLWITTAESCTGGWVAKALTDRPGSSEYVHSGLVTYSNDAKQRLLGVREDTLQIHGAVSEAVVREMVAGALAATGADVAVAISGVAGPGGGSAEKPVGTVWFAWGRSPEDTVASRMHFHGNRDDIRREAVLYVLQGVKNFLSD